MTVTYQEEGGVKLALSLVSHGRVHCLYFTLVCLLFSSARYHPSPNVVQQCKFSALITLSVMKSYTECNGKCNEGVMNLQFSLHSHYTPAITLLFLFFAVTLV